MKIARLFLRSWCVLVTTITSGFFASFLFDTHVNPCLFTWIRKLYSKTCEIAIFFKCIVVYRYAAYQSKSYRIVPIRQSVPIRRDPVHLASQCIDIQYPERIGFPWTTTTEEYKRISHEPAYIILTLDVTHKLSLKYYNIHQNN